MQGKSITIIKSIAKQLLFYIALLGLWQGLCSLNDYFEWRKSYSIPSPVGVWESLMRLIEQNALFPAIAASLQKVFIGYLISILIGIIFGLMISKSKYLSETLKPLILGVQTLPSICWVPFSVIWFGINDAAVLFVIIMGSAFSVAIAVDNAIRNVNPLYIKSAKTMGANSRELYLKVILPASLPSLLSGLKQGWSFAWRSLMAAEVMAVSVGIGQILLMRRDLADINGLMLIMIIIIIVGVFIEKFVFTIPEKRLTKKLGY